MDFSLAFERFVMQQQRRGGSDISECDETVSSVVAAIDGTGLGKVLAEIVLEGSSSSAATTDDDETAEDDDNNNNDNDDTTPTTTTAVVSALDARLSYITFILLQCKASNAPVDTDAFLCPLAGYLDMDVDDLDLRRLSEIKRIFRGTVRNRTLIKIVEKMTRGQSANTLWFLTRNRLVTGSSVQRQCSYRPHGTLARDMFRPSSRWELFGRTHEPIVRDLVAAFVEGAPVPVADTLGLVIDPFSGTFGASMDVCYGVEEGPDGLVRFGDNVKIYEIKCVAKYVYNHAEPVIRDFVARPTKRAFADIVKSATFPMIEHRHRGGVPSSGTHLVTHDRAFETNKKRKCLYEYSDEVRKLLEANRNVESTVYVFRERNVAVPSGGDGGDGNAGARTEEEKNDRGERATGGRGRGARERLEIECCAQFKANIFLNARHRYFDQAGIQYFVTTQQYISDHPAPEFIKIEELPRVSVVTALFKTKDPETRSYPLRVNGHEYGDSAVPLAVIVTPVVFDADILAAFLRETFDNYAQSVYLEGRVRVWDPNFLKGFVASHRDPEKTP
ncbi:alkaline exonuclease [Elephant endotheliotropic herpesvirus 3A]|uniref:Alkaline exonuclease n=4 Tax=unclassified Proboscivirus TaxID=548912 RepID=A0A866VSV3_9BETA|nr:alkaline exonuclease [Elephant endotheliotropic herpesvirus 3A]QOE74459.1 alkaline exonuclease [Elephant endotheliotropic herpesvirus 3A]